MRSWVRGFFTSTLLVSFAAVTVLNGRAGAATVVAVSFSGTLTSASSAMESMFNVAPGDRITGIFTYDSSLVGSAGNYVFTGSARAHTLSFIIYPPTGVENTSTQLFKDDYTGNSTLQGGGYYDAKLTPASSTATKLDITGDSTFKVGSGSTFFNSGVPAFDLTLTNPNNAGGYSSTNLPLPTTSLMTHFITTAGTLIWDPGPYRFEANLTNFSIAGVPEPSSLLLAILGALTSAVGIAIGRRNPARVSKTD